MEGDLQRVLFDESAILSRLDELAAEITREYRNKDLTVVAILNGALIFAADLLRRIPLPLKLDCVSVASYHGATTSSGSIVFNQISLPDIEGRHVLIVDDILDTGRTLDAVSRKLRSEGHPKSVKICVLLRKGKTRECQIEADYAAYDIADEFVVGYGLDYAERYRNLRCVGVLKTGFAAV